MLSMYRAKVLFFATLKDRTGVRETTIEYQRGTTVRELKMLLAQKYVGLTETLSTALVSINREFAFDEDVVPNEAEMAMFPPVSGGSGKDFPTIAMITSGEINFTAILSQITLPTTGAACFFTGVVRATTSRGKPHDTEYLEYEAYRPMAEDKMSQIAGEIRERWSDVEGIAIIQRIGVLQPGEPSVLIACTAAHRDMGVFEAARYGIDRLKEIVPVWKKEVGPGGESWVEGEYIPMQGE